VVCTHTKKSVFIIRPVSNMSRSTNIFIVLAHRHNRLRLDISLRPNYALTPLTCALSGKGTNTIFIVIVWPDHAQTTTYNNREEHANYHNTTNTVSPILNDDTCTYNTPLHVLLSTSHCWYVCKYT
jgi:hypothetical protein